MARTVTTHQRPGDDKGMKGEVRPLSITELQDTARALRRRVIKMLTMAGSGHPGGSLSAADIITALFFAHMHHDPSNPHWKNRDRFVLSKGHAAPILYAALAETGYFPVEELETFRRIDSRLQGHPSKRDFPLVEASTGSLGQGLSIGCGMALAARLDRLDYRVYVLIGDGESQEGQIWEAAMAASHYGLDNITAIVDHNGFQLDGAVAEIMGVEPLVEKWRSFGWHTIGVDGHDMAALLSGLHEASIVTGKPSVLIARTIKGKGVSFMENDNEFHGKAPTSEQAERALKELE